MFLTLLRMWDIFHLILEWKYFLAVKNARIFSLGFRVRFFFRDPLSHAGKGNRKKILRIGRGETKKKTREVGILRFNFADRIGRSRGEKSLDFSVGYIFVFRF